MRQPPQTPRKPPPKPRRPPPSAPPPPPPKRPKPQDHNNNVQYATQQAKRYKVPVKFFLSMIHQESGFNPNARSPAGAQGIGQFMPATWATLTQKYGMRGASPWDPKAALKVMARYVGGLIKQYGNLYDPLSVYNSGKPWVDGQHIPETNHYVQAVLSGSSSGYFHPLPGVPQGRTDEGVDFRPSRGQPILSIGNAVVDFIGSYRGFGPYLAYRLLDGPAKGKEIYVSESIQVVVRKGQKLKAGQAVAVATGASRGIEMGFAQTSGTYLPVANPHYNEGDVTAEGQAFSGFLGSLAGGGSVGPVDLGPSSGYSGGSPGYSYSPSGAVTSTEATTGTQAPAYPDTLPGAVLSTLPQVNAPGSVGTQDFSPHQIAQTWDLLASQPLASSETLLLAARARTATGG